MAEQITNYQCPACTGPLQFSAASGKLECEYCGSSFEIAEMEALYAQKEEAAAEAMEENWDASGLNSQWGEEAEGMKAYNCPSCGAQLICDATTAATSCPYCGNPTVVPGQFSGDLKPDYVIPFKLQKQEAIDILKGYYKGKRFLPDTFLDKHNIEKIQGVYVPFWLYDGEASGDFRFRANRIHVHRQGEYEVTVTEHFRAERSGSITFEKIPVDASTKMPDEYMDSIEPFDYSELQPFSTAYLPGFLADKYDVTLEEGNARAYRRCAYSLESALQDTVMGFTGVTPLQGNSIQIRQGKVHYALLPVWLLNVNWEGGNYLFAVNGQTGKICGRLPGCKRKATAFFAKLAVPLSILGALLARLIVG